MTNFPLFETLALIDGQVQNLVYHQQRYQNSLSEFYPKQDLKIFNLGQIVAFTLSDFIPQGSIETLPTLLRCRIDYNANTYQIRFFPYNKKTYQTFEPVMCDKIDYHLKFANRQMFAELLTQKGSADEIMIIKNGLVTDCSIGNLVFKKNGEWFTPNTPLLQGTQRAKLLAEQKISEREIRLQDIDKYEQICLINALNGLGN